MAKKSVSMKHLHPKLTSLLPHQHLKQTQIPHQAILQSHLRQKHHQKQHQQTQLPLILPQQLQKLRHPQTKLFIWSRKSLSKKQFNQTEKSGKFTLILQSKLYLKTSRMQLTLFLPNKKPLNSPNWSVKFQRSLLSPLKSLPPPFTHIMLLLSKSFTLPLLLSEGTILSFQLQIPLPYPWAMRTCQLPLIQVQKKAEHSTICCLWRTMPKTKSHTRLSWKHSTVNPRPLLSFLTLFTTGTECSQLVTSSKWLSRTIQSSVMRIWSVPPSHNKLNWLPGMKKLYLKSSNPQRLLQLQ